jgi:hypothetical protein
MEGRERAREGLCLLWSERELNGWRLFWALLVLGRINNRLVRKTALPSKDRDKAKEGKSECMWWV